MSSPRQHFEIHVNGEPKKVVGDLSVHELLEQLGLRPDRVAIEMNRKIVNRRDWLSTGVEAGAQIEIVQFVGGG